MTPNATSSELILQLLREKSSLKQDVFYTTINLFEQLKEMVKLVATELKPAAEAIDKRLMVEYRERTPYEIELRVAGDVLLFQMHTNVFEFETSHAIWKTGYVKENAARSYCGVINVYNFLADSFKYQRLNDLGYLIGRLFVNHEQHFFVEGKRQLAFLYNDFANAVITPEALRQIVESTIVYCLDFDLFTPPFDEVKVISLGQVQEESSLMSLKTGKRLGFRFQADSDSVL